MKLIDNQLAHTIDDDLFCLPSSSIANLPFSNTASFIIHSLIIAITGPTTMGFKAVVGIPVLDQQALM
jgi:hypothetical protein